MEGGRGFSKFFSSWEEEEEEEEEVEEEEEEEARPPLSNKKVDFFGWDIGREEREKGFTLNEGSHLFFFRTLLFPLFFSHYPVEGKKTFFPLPPPFSKG